MIALAAPESQLLHHVGKNCRARAGLRIDFQQPAQGRELNLLDIARAVTAQFPVMS